MFSGFTISVLIAWSSGSSSILSKRSSRSIANTKYFEYLGGEADDAKCKSGPLNNVTGATRALIEEEEEKPFRDYTDV